MDRLRDPLLVISAAGWVLTGELLVLLQWFDPRGLLHCPLKTLVSLPCPTCGLTRMFVALAGGEWMQALALQPLGLAVLLLGLCYAPARACGVLPGPVFPLRNPSRRAVRAAAIAGVCLLGLNWVYLVEAGI